MRPVAVLALGVLAALSACTKSSDSKPAGAPAPGPAVTQPAAAPGATTVPGGSGDGSPAASGSPIAATNDPAKVGTIAIDTDTDVALADGQLKIGSSLSYVAPESLSNLPATVGTLAVEGTGLALAEQTDFDKASFETVVTDPSMQGLDGPNDILCVLAQTGYTTMVGKGDYFAVVDDDCTAKTRTGATYPKTVTVNATRAPNKPLVVKVWWERVVGGDVAAEVTIVEGASQQNPFGLFRAVYTAGNPNDKQHPFKNGFEVTEGADHALHLSVVSKSEGVLRAQADLARAGDPLAIVSGASREADSDNAGGSYDQGVAFDLDHYFINVTSRNDRRCRDRKHYDLRVDSYDLFAADTGARVKTSGTFREVAYKDAAGNDVHGLIGPDSVYFGDQKVLADGDKVDVYDADDFAAATTEYTAKVAPGSFRNQKVVTLDAARAKATRWAVDFTDPDTSLTVHAVLRYNDGDGHFEVVAKKVPDDANPGTNVTQELATPVAFTTTDTDVGATTEGGDTSIYYHLNLDAGQGYKLLSVTYTDQSPAHFAAAKTFWCFHNCPKGGLSQADLQNFMNGGDTTIVYYADAADAASMYRYDYDPLSGDLRDTGHGNTAVTAAYTVVVGGQTQKPGVSSGVLVPDADHQTLKANATYFSALDPALQTYTFTSSLETLTTVLVDAQGHALDFTPVRHLGYVFAKDDDRSGHDASPFFGAFFDLVPNVSGGLDGIPQKDYAPAFSLKDGTVIGDGVKVKARQVFEVMNLVGTDQCAALTGVAFPELPAANRYDEAQPAAKPAYFGPPAFVFGVPAS